MAPRSNAWRPGCADGIRTRDLELMRLARTTAPPPRACLSIALGEGDRRTGAEGAGPGTRLRHAGAGAPGDVVGASRPPFDPGSAGMSVVLRGGALEPGARIVTCKQTQRL